MSPNGTGVVPALMLIGVLAGVAVGCDDGRTVDLGEDGRMRVLLTDAPFPFDAVAHVNS